MRPLKRPGPAAGMAGPFPSGWVRDGGQDAVTSPRAGLWTVAQATGVLLTAALLAGLVMEPGSTLTVLWNAVIPLLPAVFLVNPAIWRNVCPLATLNMITGGRGDRARPGPEAARWTGLVGIGLLAAMVPARRFLFNTDGLWLAGTIAGVGILALLMGLVYSMKAGFCNGICPVLPVERLYGQRPLVRVGNPRCTTCSLCTSRGCLDLAPGKSVAQALGRARRSHRWLQTPFGAFCAAFPGFVIGYYTTVDVPLSGAPGVYGHVGLWSLGSWVVVSVLVRSFDIEAGRAILSLGGAAIGLYYWLAAPVVTEGLGLEAWMIPGLRTVALLLVGAWLFRAYRTGPPRPRPAPMESAR